MSENRIKGQKVDLDADAIKSFFQNRSSRYDENNPLVSVIYQDSNPELAKTRDAYEKEKLLPLISVNSRDHVLDIGCGIGRWADSFKGQVKSYHGVDIDSGLIKIARKRFADTPSFSFQQLAAQDVSTKTLEAKPPFTLILVVGVLMYINDTECQTFLNSLSDVCTPETRILIREPIGTQERLTLNKIYSEELKHEYSAIYRTVPELEAMIEWGLENSGLELKKSEHLFPDDLRNRKETRQHYFIAYN